MDADVVGFQEVFEESALRAVNREADEIGDESNEDVIPDRSKRYRKKAIFRKLKYAGYRDAALAFAPNVNDGAPGQRRPGVVILSRFGFESMPDIIQGLPEPLDIPFQDMGGGGGGH